MHFKQKVPSNIWDFLGGLQKPDYGASDHDDGGGCQKASIQNIAAVKILPFKIWNTADKILPFKIRNNAAKKLTFKIWNTAVSFLPFVCENSQHACVILATKVQILGDRCKIWNIKKQI